MTQYIYATRQDGFQHLLLTQAGPALINDRVSNNKPPRLTGDQSARFYQEWGAAHDD